MSKWFSKPKFSTLNSHDERSTAQVPPGLYFQCPECSTMIYRKEFEESLSVCPKCNYHARLTAVDRINQITDEGSFKETHEKLTAVDFLKFEAKKKYSQQIEGSKKKTGLNDAIVTGVGEINGMKAAIAVMDFHFLGGSMGSVVGEKITRTFETALEKEIPAITFTTTGGARMMESIVSLMQMAKTSALCAQLDKKGIPYISVLTDPSTAGVMASFAALGDLLIAEPNCIVGFAGRRVIEQTVREHLPRDFQKSEFVLEHGFVDIVCSRTELKGTFGNVLNKLWAKKYQAQKVVPVEGVKRQAAL